MAELTGSEILAKCLKKEGIEDIFYIMGGPMLLAESTCITEGIRMIDVRHEQAAAFACQAYSRLRQTPSVCMAASGPGVTNLITGMANALIDCCPVVAFGGSSPISQFGRQVFQEIDQVKLMEGCCKHVDRVHNLKRIPQQVNFALQKRDDRQAGPGLCRYAGRHPLPEDRREPGRLELRRTPSMDSRPLGDPRQVDALVKALAEAKQPLIVSGSGVIWSRAWAEMQAFVEAAGIPFYTTPQGRGVVPDDHRVLVPDDAQRGVRRCRPDHRARHADELHHRPRRAAALRRQREDRPHRHRSGGDRRGGARRRHPDRRRLQDGAAATARRHQGQGDAGQLQGVAAEAGGRRGAEALGGRRQQVCRGRRHPSGAHARGDQELRQARRDPVRRRAGDAEFRAPDDADVLAGASAELGTVRHDGRRPAVRRRRQGRLPGQAGDRGARRRLAGHERDGDGHRDPPQDPAADRGQPERRLDRRSDSARSRAAILVTCATTRCARRSAATANT